MMESLPSLEAVDSALRELSTTDDVLIFFPGEREILDAQRYLGGRGFAATDFVPLFGRMSA